MLLNLEGAPYAEVFLYIMVSIKFPNTDDDQRTFVILVQATSNDNVPLCEFGNKISDTNTIREIDLMENSGFVDVSLTPYTTHCRHAVGSIVRVLRYLLKTKLSNSVFHLLTSLLVQLKPLLDRGRCLGNLFQGSIVCTNEVDGRCCEVHRFASFVCVHDWQPLLPTGVIRRHWGLAVLRDCEGSLASSDDAETWRSTKTFLASCEDDVNTPSVHADFFTCDRADTVKDNL